MKTWKNKIDVPKFGICTVKEANDEEANYGVAPFSHGFVNLYKNGKKVGWCGTLYAKSHIIGKKNGHQTKKHDFDRKQIEKLKRENAMLKAYADKLADGLPCLPKDIEVLRKANSGFARENAELREDKERLNWVLKTTGWDRNFIDAARREQP